MAFVRRRYYVWLARAYVRRWKKTIFASLVIGAVTFFLFSLFISYYAIPLINRDYQKIGYAGSYTLNTLPDEILADISYGLTSVSKNGSIRSAAASSWTISQDGKTYTFTLQKNLQFSSGKKFTAEDIPYSFSDVKKKIISQFQIQYTLKNEYAPFLSVLSKPIVKNNYGLNSYYISKIEENTGFIKSLTLSQKNSKHKKIYYFYPTQEALMTAFELGEVDEIHGVSYSSSPSKAFSTWKNIQIKKNVDTGKLVAIFFNTIDTTFSNKKIRQALLYALPDSFDEGERTYSFIPQSSMYYTKSPNEGLVDIDLSKSLLKASGVQNLKITIITDSNLHPVAQKIADYWKKIDVQSTIQESNGIPVNFSVFLYSMNLPKDPDMYSIWHSDQVNNIMHYSNVRIDKLLEDGRQTTDEEKRIVTYSDVQKYLLDDSPTAFLYFPYTYAVIRK